MSNETPNVNQPEPVESIPDTLVISLKDFDNLDFEKMKPIIKAALENIQILNYMMATIVDHLGIDFEHPQQHNASTGDEGIGQYL